MCENPMEENDYVFNRANINVLIIAGFAGDALSRTPYKNSKPLSQRILYGAEV